MPKDSLQSFTAHLNEMEPAIQFTTEEEAYGRLTFLDILVKSDGMGLSFTVSRKKTHTGQYLHFNSVHPAAQKRSMVASLFRRADRICSRPEDRMADNMRVRYELSSCGYLEAFIDSVQRQRTRPVHVVDVGHQGCAAIPYMSGISEVLTHTPPVQHENCACAVSQTKA